MRISYPGPHRAVHVPALGLVVERGQVVDVPDEVARPLLTQGWAEARPRRTREEGD